MKYEPIFDHEFSKYINIDESFEFNNKFYNKFDPLTKEKVNVCIVGVFDPYWSSNTSFSRALQKREDIGEVTEFDYRKCMKTKYNSIVNNIQELSRNCDLMFIMKGNGIPVQAIKLASSNCLIYHWFPDWFPMFKQHKELFEISRYCHYRSATGWENAKLWSEKINLPVFHVFDGADPFFYFPTGDKKIYDFTFIGGIDTERKTVYEFLKKQGIKVSFFGPGFTKFVEPGEWRKICSQSKITLNLSRGNYKGYSSKRLWDLGSCGSMVITKKIESMETYMNLKEKIHIVTFSNLINLKNLITFYLENEEERKKIAKNFREFVLKYRTWDNSVNNILNIVRNNEGFSMRTDLAVDKESLKIYNDKYKKPKLRKISKEKQKRINRAIRIEQTYTTDSRRVKSKKSNNNSKKSKGFRI